MSLDYLSFEEFISMVVAEFRSVNPDVDPTVDEFARGFNEGLAAACLSLQSLIRDLEKQAFPQTATGDDLAKWGGYEDLPRNPAVGASGLITLPGTVPTTLIPLNAAFTGGGFTYTSTAASTIVDVTASIASITRAGNIATVFTTADHNLATGQEITVAGATETEYNGTFVITSQAANQFTYIVDGLPSTPATGTITYNAIFASIDVQCTDVGQDTNLDSGAQLTISIPISGAENTALVQFGGIAGGADIETDEEYRSRILLSRSLLEGVFTNGQIELAAKRVEGNTRIFIINPELTTCATSPDIPTPGQVVVYVLRDNDVPITPTPAILADTKQEIIDYGRLPAHTSEDDLFVFAPTLVPTDFIFSSINPDTPTMQTAIQQNLAAFFEDSIDFATTITEASYLGAIQNTQDLVTGDFLISFSLNAPSGDIVINNGEIATLGDVTFV